MGSTGAERLIAVGFGRVASVLRSTQLSGRAFGEASAQFILAIV